MTCQECGSAMVRVGREIQPGHPEVWMDGYVCPTRRCYYGALDYRASEIRWPAMTLMPELPLHAMIRGAMKFRDR